VGWEKMWPQDAEMKKVQMKTMKTKRKCFIFFCWKSFEWL